MNEGKIIEYIDQGKFVCAVCLKDKGNRLHLLTPLNREVNLSPKRAILISNLSVDTLGPRQELLNKLKRTEAMRERLKGEVHVEELWRLVRDEAASFDYKDLAQLCFEGAITDDHTSAIVRALFEDRLYFKMRDGCFLPNSEETVDQIVRRREAEALREERLEKGSAWLKGVIADKGVQQPTQRDEIIDLLKELALFGNDAPNFKYGKEMLLRSGISDIQKARALLVKLGVWEEDENLDLHRLDIKASFSKEIINASERLRNTEIEKTGREDLTHLSVFTIDGPLTRDFDDALSMEVSPDGILLGVHIADVAGAIPPDSLLDREASQRGSSLYLTRRQIPMLPQDLSQDALSLREGCERPAISLICRIDEQANIIDYRFTSSLVKVQRRLTYDQVNELYMNDGVMEKMHRVSQQLRQKRIEKGALILSLPEMIVRIGPDSSLHLVMVDQETPSRTMVAELMILYNWLTARFCRDNQIPILFRGQEEPSERLSRDEAGYYYFVFKQRRKLNPLMIDTQPRPHTGLGLDVYTNVSSPIRRYLDLVIQRQIRNHLVGGGFLYGKEELEAIRLSVEPILRDLERVKRNRIRYWIQKYLLQHVGEKFPALILDSLKSRYRILLTDFLMVAEMRRENDQDLSEGQKIMVTVKKSDPWNDQLTVEYVRG